MTLTPHPLTNFEIQAYYQNEARFNEVFSRDIRPNNSNNNNHNNNDNNNNNNSNIKNGAYVINLDEYRDIGTHCVALYVNNKTVTYLDSVGVEHIPKEIMKFIDNTSFGLSSRRKNIITNIYRMQAYDSIM